MPCSELFLKLCRPAYFLNLLNFYLNLTGVYSLTNNSKTLARKIKCMALRGKDG